MGNTTYKKISQLLSDPRRWTQNADAINGDGAPVSGSSVHATAWCLRGAIHKLHDNLHIPAMLTALQLKLQPFGGITKFNDAHSHAEVLAKVIEIEKTVYPTEIA